MAAKVLVLNPFTSEFDYINIEVVPGSGLVFVPEYINMDKPGAVFQDTWVRKTTGPTKIEWTFFGTTGEKLRVELT